MKHLIKALALFILSSSCQAESFTCTIKKVIDGDTIRVNCSGKNELVRLIGIDTPETTDHEKAHRQADRLRTDLPTLFEMGEKSKKFLQSSLSAQNTVKIETDVEARDKYGRLLGYIYDSQSTMLNEKILRFGYAQLLTMPPNIRYVEKLKIAYLDGRRAKRGLWSYEAYKHVTDKNLKGF